MPIQRTLAADGQLQVALLDPSGKPIPIVSAFLRHLATWDYSPNTLIGYAHDLQHFWQFLLEQGLSWDAFRPPQALACWEYLRTTPSRRRVQRVSLRFAPIADGKPAARLAPTTINRMLAAVSMFYEYVIVSGGFDGQNPIEKSADPNLRRVSERYQPFLSGISRQRPVRRRIAVKTVPRLPRPLSDAK